MSLVPSLFVVAEIQKQNKPEKGNQVLTFPPSPPILESFHFPLRDKRNASRNAVLVLQMIETMFCMCGSACVWYQIVCLPALVLVQVETGSHLSLSLSDKIETETDVRTRN